MGRCLFLVIVRHIFAFRFFIGKFSCTSAIDLVDEVESKTIRSHIFNHHTGFKSDNKQSRISYFTFGKSILFNSKHRDGESI